MSAENNANNEPRNTFIHEIIDADLASGKHSMVVTRFPPEPNGYLHIGHAKTIVFNSGLARTYAERGIPTRFHLRFDDTNPTTEDTEYVESIKADVKWLGGDFGDNLFFASDYFERMYGWAQELIRKDLAYVDEQSVEEIREGRGSFTEPGTNSPFRDRPVEESLALFAKMRAGDYPDGSIVLRAKIDMTHPNMVMRDPLLYRVRHAHHHRTGDAWCIYPMYDFAHCLEDAIEGITHSICTLEFENNRDVYDWLIENIDELNTPTRPNQFEFARLNLGYTVMSKRKLRRLVEDGDVRGWDDPRMPTVAGMRRRGITPSAIRSFLELTGISKTNSMVDLGKLEYAIRKDLEHTTDRAMGVQAPLKVTITNLPDETRWIQAPLRPSDDAEVCWLSGPEDSVATGHRALPLSKTVYIEQSDFMEEPTKKFHRLAPGKEVRLRYAYVLRCDKVIKNEAGEVIELLCSADLDTFNAHPADGRRVKGVIHWVSASEGVPVEARLYDRLFTVESPDAEAEKDFKEFLNPNSLVESQLIVEPWLTQRGAGERVQLERTGFFVVDALDSAPGKPIFNRIVTLRDTWAKIAGTATVEVRNARKDKSQRGVSMKSNESERDKARAADATLMARYQALLDLGVNSEHADLLGGDYESADWFDALMADTQVSTPELAKWAVQAYPSIAPNFESAKFGGDALGELISLIEAKTISAGAAKEVLSDLIVKGGSVATIVAEKGLEQVSDTAALEAMIDTVLAKNEDKVAAYRAGKTALIGFFVGQVMRASKGKANASLVKPMLEAKLEG